VDRKVIDMLALTLNHDGNTNVRLAALSLMQKYSEDEYVSSLLVSSLYEQGDPIVQLGLVTMLGKTKNTEINAKLESLVNSPETFAAVRDEAYRILLNQNKL
jgi:HEAT repeat protein